MSYWRIIKIPEAEALDTDLTGTELTGLGIAAGNAATLSELTEINVYYRAWRKIQPQVEKSIEENED